MSNQSPFSKKANLKTISGFAELTYIRNGESTDDGPCI